MADPCLKGWSGHFSPKAGVALAAFLTTRLIIGFSGPPPNEPPKTQTPPVRDYCGGPVERLGVWEPLSPSF